MKEVHVVQLFKDIIIQYRSMVWGRHVNLVWNLRWSWIRVWKLGPAGPKSSTDGGTYTWLRVSSPEFLLNYAQIILFLKRHHFGTCFLLIHYTIWLGYNNISRPPRDYPTLKSGVVVTTPGLTLLVWGLPVYRLQTAVEKRRNQCNESREYHRTISLQTHASEIVLRAHKNRAIVYQ